MPEDRLWTIGNRVPSEFVTKLELARRKAEEHRKATPEAWQDYVALRKLVKEAVGKLLVLEDERESFIANMTIQPPPEDADAEALPDACLDAIAGSLAHICSTAFKAGWEPEAVYAAIHRWTDDMAEFDRKATGRNPHGGT
ncbi:MAG: hypothetical protein CML24_11390 [Rhizobiales bacterium]|nr:hypothetical protein [Hyphomicrobiales bacterium]|tara:strand:+ start:9797 stop:10219 length:423 start_codon:yes stop_codon:yes gene_type:complete